MREVAIIGVGSTVFGKFPEKAIFELGTEAVQAALKDAGISPKDIQFAYYANLYGGMVEGQAALRDAGITDIEITNVENACTGGATAVRRTWYDIASGLYDIGIAVGSESMTTSPIAGKLIPPAKGDLSGELGMNTMAKFALSQRRYMDISGVTLEQIAMVSVKNHHNGCANPYSQYKKEFSAEDIINSRLICDPITQLQSCSTTDGAAAVILTSLNVARRYTRKPVIIAASVIRGGDYAFRQKDITFSDVTYKGVKGAYTMAGIGPEDINLCELHDAFAVNELQHYVELGFCERGEEVALLMDGVTNIKGRLPVNPSGGLLSKGHPLSATGVAQIAEIVWQLRGQAGKNQVPDAKVGLTHTLGGEVADLEAGAVGVHILKV
ncbi:MAG TPA: thiolase family protein [Dehalococcoidia bacterium]|nr:thiolase family protein [Dehalococcoidia bacterium]